MHKFCWKDLRKDNYVSMNHQAHNSSQLVRICPDGASQPWLREMFLK